MSTSGDFGNPLRKFKLVFLGEQSGKLNNTVVLKLMRCTTNLRTIPGVVEGSINVSPYIFTSFSLFIFK